MQRLAAAVLVTFVAACTGVLDPGPSPDPIGDPDPTDPGSTDPDPDPTDPDPADPDPTPLTITEVQVAFDAALLAALSGAAGATVVDTRAEARIDGAVTAGAATVSFTNLRLTKGPFALAGSASVSSRGELATVTFAGGTAEGQVAAGGAPVGSFTAAYPAIDDLAEDTVIELLGLVLECQGLDVTEVDATLTFNGTCTLRDEGGAALGTATLAGVEIDLANATASGTITVDAGGVVAEIRLLGTVADLIVDGNAVGTVDLSALVAALL